MAKNEIALANREKKIRIYERAYILHTFLIIAKYNCELD